MLFRSVALRCKLILASVGYLVNALVQSVHTCVHRHHCTFSNAALDGVSLDPSLTFGLKINVTCTNPNPYGITIADSKSGKVFIGNDRTEAGSVVTLPSSALLAEGTGSILAVNTIPGSSLGGFIGLLGSQVPIQLELDFDVIVDVSFFFGGWKVSMPFSKDCGMNMAGLSGLVFNPDGAHIGPMACADSFSSLQIPDVNTAQATGDTMRFSALKIAPEEVEKGQLAKKHGSLAIPVYSRVLAKTNPDTCFCYSFFPNHH